MKRRRSKKPPRCAICGRRAPSKKRGTVTPHPTLVAALRALGRPMKKPKSEHLHTGCALKAQRS